MGLIEIKEVDSLNYGCDICGPTMKDLIVPTVEFYDHGNDKEVHVCQPCIEKALAMLVRYS